MSFKLRHKFIITVLFVIWSFAQLAGAATLKSLCYEADADVQVVHGINYRSKYEIGSVSKVMTSYWAVAQYGLQHRFKTHFILSYAGNNTWDLHIKGGRDPFFGKQAFQVAIAELNRVKITKIRRLSFDSGFKYFIAPTSIDVARGYYRPSDPDAQTVTAALRETFDNLMHGYPDLVNKYQSVLANPLPAQIELSVKKIVFDNNFSEAKAKSSINYEFLSIPLIHILKQMNIVSNNNVANQIFESLGGAREFKTFIKDKMNLTRKDITMFNGSGDKYYNSHNDKVYNVATCETVIKVLKELRSEIVKQDASVKLEDIFAVVGDDTDSTAQRYSNDLTSDAVIAKTGTVDPSISLAGFISTMNGGAFFTSIQGTDGTVADWRSARIKIQSELSHFLIKNGGKKTLSYQRSPFVPFDFETKLRLVPYLLEAINDKFQK